MAREQSASRCVLSIRLRLRLGSGVKGEPSIQLSLSLGVDLSNTLKLEVRASNSIFARHRVRYVVGYRVGYTVKYTVSKSGHC